MLAVDFSITRIQCFLQYEYVKITLKIIHARGNNTDTKVQLLHDSTAHGTQHDQMCEKHDGMQVCGVESKTPAE